MRWALNLMCRKCEKESSLGVGACFEMGRTVDAEYLADRVCNSCLAFFALQPFEMEVSTPAARAGIAERLLHCHDTHTLPTWGELREASDLITKLQGELIHLRKS
jgi:hypothetical protein